MYMVHSFSFFSLKWNRDNEDRLKLNFIQPHTVTTDVYHIPIAVDDTPELQRVCQHYAVSNFTCTYFNG